MCFITCLLDNLALSIRPIIKTKQMLLIENVCQYGTENRCFVLHITLTVCQNSFNLFPYYPAERGIVDVYLLMEFANLVSCIVFAKIRNLTLESGRISSVETFSLKHSSISRNRSVSKFLLTLKFTKGNTDACKKVKIFNFILFLKCSLLT